MALRKHIKYQWRLFFPLVALIWLVVIVLGVWMNKTERALRIENIRAQIALVNARIIKAYSDDTDPMPFIKFIGRYYQESPLFDDIRLSLYHNNRCIYFIGEPISPSETRDIKAGNVVADGKIGRVHV